MEELISKGPPPNFPAKLAPIEAENIVRVENVKG
jgi:hypothetical protein